MHGLTANNIANKVTAKTYEDIKANNVGDNTKLTSSMHGISITTTTGNNVVLQSYENIYLAKVGNDCEIKSRMHGVRISGVTGSNVDINAYEDIRTQHLGAHAHVKSSMHAVSVGNVGPASVIQAYDNININGYCASNAKVKSSMGQVYKNGGTKDPSYFTITAPILEEKPKALQILEEKPKALQIPDAFKCPESGEIMTNPVVFRTSGKTYDESSIRQKLTNMGFEENEITEQLVPNLVLKMMISKFMTDNKEHLQSAKMGR
jgi:hypothetical protein